ncbi:MAG: acetate/propionate family kinase [Chitinophagaceae bacterium]
MHSGSKSLLVINGGSSSIKFAIYKMAGISESRPERGTEVIAGDKGKIGGAAGDPDVNRGVTDESLEDMAGSLEGITGSIEDIGSAKAVLRLTQPQEKTEDLSGKVSDFDHAAGFLIDWLEKQEGFNNIIAIGHRVVHGMGHQEAEIITPSLMKDLNDIVVYDPEHLPLEIKLIELFTRRHPHLMQVACFDTAFHNTMPRLAKLLPIPGKYFDKGIRRYGFHGLSFAYLMRELNSAAEDRIILAHLGNGASMAAVREGKSMDTSMGFTPASGLVMGTRTGDLDPGIGWYLIEMEKMSATEYSQLVNHKSGLLGLSGTTSDMRELIRLKDHDSRAADAFGLFCYQAKKNIGAYAAVLGGLDTLVFSGGIGEHSPEVRSAICGGLGFLGIEIDEIKNVKSEPVISSDNGKVTVRVIATNEQVMIATLVNELLKHHHKI